MNPEDDDLPEADEDLDHAQNEEDEGDERPGDDGGQEEREGQDPDGSEDETGSEGREVLDPPANSRQRRSQSRWQQRERELQEARRRAEEAEARAAGLTAERQQVEAQRQQALQQDRERRREAMTPEERLSDDIGELRAQINFQRDMDAFYRNDAEDKAQYRAIASVNKVYKRHESKVEELLKQSRARGTNMSREQILRYVIGDEALKTYEQASKPRANTRRVVSRPINSRGDGTSTPSRRGPSSEHEARTKRLMNVPL